MTIFQVFCFPMSYFVCVLQLNLFKIIFKLEYDEFFQRFSLYFYTTSNKV